MTMIHQSMNKNGRLKAWRKVLYENNGFPDNYTPKESFLAAIEKNKDLQVYSLSECFHGAAEVSKKLCTVVIFWCCYDYLKSRMLHPNHLLVFMLSFSLTIFGALLLLRKLNLEDVVGIFKTGVKFSVIGYAMSPILYKLTDSISTDTIHSMASCSFLLHLLTSDYGMTAPIVSWQISINAAIFSTVCLASRFDHHLMAFSLICLSVCCFLLIPILNPLTPNSLACKSFPTLISIFLLGATSNSLLFLFLVAIMTLQIACPVVFYNLQSAKQTIHGPWDEATPFTAKKL